jgi:polysaccharide export outer membrane protein
MSWKLSVCAAALGLLCACAGPAQLSSSSTAVRVATALPPPDTTVVPVAIAPYHVVPGDELTVSIFGAPELGSTGLVDGAGNFSMPLAGTLHVAGLTPEEISAAVETKLRGAYVKNPHVALNVKQTGNQQAVTVDGEVQQPGIYPVTGQMTLQQAIATAHGTSDTANIRNVVVFRTVNNQKMAALFDLKLIRSGRAPDPAIYGNDIVVVGQSAIQKFLRNTTMAFPLVGRFIPLVL